ncbi:Hypothetical protein, putative [Bodo saltans]|uniref:HMG box domain-containing protein n=1 Tax=Bodo saltans TaxID=75058 RepID=A0A0S4IYC0_BODSA|nr:Hypothetical protein, putative [Bodo saltans]|eukprot:CUG15632.1 Hypothetical protein, putative [Bodo saltans]
MPRKPPRTQRKAPAKKVKKQPPPRKTHSKKNHPQQQRKPKHSTLVVHDHKQSSAQRKMENLKREVEQLKTSIQRTKMADRAARRRPPQKRQGAKNAAVLLDLSREDVQDLDSMLLQLIRALFEKRIIPTVSDMAKALNVNDDIATELVGLNDDAIGKRQLAQRLQSSKPLRITVSHPGNDAHRVVRTANNNNATNRRHEEFHCHVCHVEVDSAKSWKSHLSGWRHTKNATAVASRSHNHSAAHQQRDFYEDTAPSNHYEQGPDITGQQSHNNATQSSAYLKFCESNHEGMKTANPTFNHTEILKALSTWWQQLSPSDKALFA